MPTKEVVVPKSPKDQDSDQIERGALLKIYKTTSNDIVQASPDNIVRVPGLTLSNDIDYGYFQEVVAYFTVDTSGDYNFQAPKGYRNVILRVDGNYVADSQHLVGSFYLDASLRHIISVTAGSEVYNSRPQDRLVLIAKPGVEFRPLSPVLRPKSKTAPIQ